MSRDKCISAYRHHLANLIIEYQIMIARSKQDKITDSEFIEKIELIGSKIQQETQKLKEHLVSLG
ncbi:hypothetical protein [Pseudobacteriovorax antillogorgiicola]|uniref:Four helix bundle protein n=1 Tax=Pseudobacteriovorax antillogorgiicola TaxID=1513793 RepID=A0A1Y6C533_9BACT|nr:hypothetical protein [Pseudobacteriovorax antillogorgiicola]TCS43393.1 hypothetical protein EDD56_13733 [Pseudobacteriovorax antillogorgiicola]SMF34899.1 hypothetical protein SAMN06296036_110175 [Pseudobacteriovorax antillogorgiicola]